MWKKKGRYMFDLQRCSLLPGYAVVSDLRLVLPCSYQCPSSRQIAVLMYVEELVRSWVCAP